MPQVRLALRDLLAGGVFIALGLAFAGGSLAYDIGTPVRWVRATSRSCWAVLAGLGILVIIKGSSPGRASDRRVEWRAVSCPAALLLFGITVGGWASWGVVRASLLAALARSQTSIREALVISVGLTALSVVIFSSRFSCAAPRRLLDPI